MGHSACLRAQQLRRNDADSSAQIRADTASVMGAKTSISDRLVEEWRPKTLGYMCLSEGLFHEGSNLEKQVVSSKLNRTSPPGQSGWAAYQTMRNDGSAFARYSNCAAFT